jgi:hypothetical protein
MNEKIWQKLLFSIKREGALASLEKIARYLSRDAFNRRRRYREMLETKDVKTRFEKIYIHNLWGDSASVSGAGSNLETTKNLRDKLPSLFVQYDITTVLDVPCGDFYWMRHVVKDAPKIRYIGGDIVSQIIESNSQQYKSKNVRFSVIDLRFDELPDADIIIVRDCLFHFSFDDIKKVKANIKRSKIKYILTTTHIIDKEFSNTDITTGDFRLIDIFKEPFCFRGPVLERIADYVGLDTPREMCLLSIAEM